MFLQCLPEGELTVDELTNGEAIDAAARLKEARDLARAKEFVEGLDLGEGAT
jgi:hypothetical protein